MRSPSQLLFAGAAVAIFAATAIACRAPTPAQDETNEGELTSSPRKGEEFVRCWTTSDGTADEFFRRYELKCRVSSAGLPGLRGTSVYVDASSATGASRSSGAPGDTPDQDVVIGGVSKSDFPLELAVYGHWTAARTQESLSYYSIKLPATEANTEATPVIVKLPFDAWPVRFLNRLPFVVVSSGRYDVDVAPFVTEQDSRSTKTTLTTTAASSGFMRDVPRFDLDLVAPKAGGIEVHVQGSGPAYDVTLAAPGTYVIERSGLRLATAEEEREAAGTPAADAGVPTSGDASAPDGASADSGALPPPPSTCGDPAQAPCSAAGGGRSCNAGTRLDSNTNKCVACGDDGETYCFTGPGNTSGSSSCNAGTRLDSNTYKCVACGNAGQTYCFTGPGNTSGSGVCNPGLRIVNNLCAM